MASKRDEIMDAAEVRIRRGGYQGFSFRDIADDVGIKSASVHYHFPTKEDLAEAVTDRYTDRFIEMLDASSFEDPKATLTEGFLHAIKTQQQMCLCGILGSESGILPVTVRHKVDLFFDRISAWLINAMGGDDHRTEALRHVALLEGAMLMARTKQSADYFDLIVDR